MCNSIRYNNVNIYTVKYSGFSHTLMGMSQWQMAKNYLKCHNLKKKSMGVVSS
jgi:hypothetical protein